MPDFGVFELIHIETGQSFYTTHATTEEILHANFNLKTRGEALRYHPKGAFTMPSIHTDGG